MRLGDKGYLQFTFPSERHFKSFGHMAEMIASLPLGLYFLSLSDSVHIVICACEKVQECLICIRRVEVILKKSSHWKLCVQSKETLSHTWWGPVRTMVAIIHLINRHSWSPWRRKWQPTPVFLPAESCGLRSLVGYRPWGCRELDTTECLSLHFVDHLLCVHQHLDWIVRGR